MRTPTSTSRRGFVGALGAGAAALAVTACGFKLRQAPIFAFQTIALPAAPTAYLSQLRRAINVTGSLTAVPPEQNATAQVVFEVLGEARDTTIISSDAAGQVREMQLNYRVRFRLRTQDGRELIGPSEMAQSRDISYNETAALAKESESNLLYRDMTADIVQQTLRRLSAVKSL
ncbi:LPS assembly lipoprotein LptE [Variovorax sp. J22R133]|uniref:LPS-assembly lipoprotein LptE n=1 Tax=Variovorax brevis TaxID=3053503 RepID=UPI0025763F37|nr:LPS assembly lipoprotein LptE [Variovorax sp. J22R133]MDM0115529.1 LPS assembly lipoprotein LptE [Variovorax sp. J22R133]